MFGRGRGNGTRIPPRYGAFRSCGYRIRTSSRPHPATRPPQPLRCRRRVSRSTRRVRGDLLVTYRAICQQRGQGDDGHYLFPGYGEHRLHEPIPTLPLNPRTMTAWVCDLIREAGVVDENGKHLTDLQGLRATGVSVADAAGVPESIIEAQLGHKGRGVYQRHYRDVRTAPERFQFADVFETTPNDLPSTAMDQNRGSDEQLQLVFGA